MSSLSTDQKNGMILSAGWASLAVYVIYCFELSEVMLAGAGKNESLVWTRAKANILLNVNHSISPCDDMYEHSCELLLTDTSGAFFDAQNRANWFIENTPAHQACMNNDQALIADGDGYEGSGGYEGAVQTAFLGGCTLYNLSVVVRVVNGTYKLVLDTRDRSSDDLQSKCPSCLATAGLEREFQELAPNVLFGGDLCSALDLSQSGRPPCDRLRTCKEYVTAFYPESLSSYRSISPADKAKLTSQLNAVMGANRTVHFGGGMHLVRDAPPNMLGANASDLMVERRERILALLGTADAGAWQMPGTDANAYYSLVNDAVYIAGGLLVEPFYHPEYPWVHNLAGIGFIVAHEIGHSFGPRAAQQFHRPNTTDVVTALVANLTARATHPAAMYGSELFADWKAANALDTLVLQPTALFFHHMAQAWCQRHQQWYTDDPHPPHRWRVNMSVTAFASFSRVFHCAGG